MGKREDRRARRAALAIEQPLDVERFALGPGGKARAGQDIVEGHGQRHPLGLGIKGVEGEDADLGKRRVDDTADQRLHRQILPRRQKWSSSELSRICSRLCSGSPLISTRARRLVAVELTRLLRVSISSASFGGRRLETAEHRHRYPGTATGGVDGHLGLGPEGG